MRVLGIIPARFASSRFPGKPLVDIKGKPMIQRVYEQVKKVKGIEKVIIATDDERILNVVQDFGGEAMLTSDKHHSGTDRCAEVVKRINDHFDVAINIQGDEPFIHPDQILQVINCFEERGTQISTLIKEIRTYEDLLSPNVVKAVITEQRKALYFSRNPIPYCRDLEVEECMTKHTFYKHIGIYAYKPEVLLQISRLSHSGLEKCESLEQLRWLENGYSILTAITGFESKAVDTPEDLQKILDL